jgi:hypothetical protein
MRTTLFAAGCLLSLIATTAQSRGVSPYLPVNLEPEIERQIQRVLILADKPILTRPYAAATVLEALPKACEADIVLCTEVRSYLDRYMHGWGLTEASIEGAASSGSTTTVPNRYGLTTESSWAASARGYWQPSDYLLMNLGAVAYQGEVVPEGSMLSLGFDRAQLDIGYRARWLSPFTDSAMLSSTEAATMPSVTLSNYVPLTRWGIHYEAFLASMSVSDKIEFNGRSDNSGRPRLGGLHFSIEPASGWALGLTRLLQFGGGGRPGSISDLVSGFFNPSKRDNNVGVDQQLGNQVAAVSSELIFPGRVPFSVYFEYAGEDTSGGQNYLLGNTSLSGGITFPRLWRRFDLTFEVSEWQNAWYVNGAYGDGLTNKGHVIGHWGGDDRVFGNDVGAQSAMIQLGWQPSFGGRLDTRLRTLDNESYFNVQYERAYDATVRYSYPFPHFIAGAEVIKGRDVFGENFSRVSAFFRYANETRAATSWTDSDAGPDPTAQLFVEAGPSFNRVRIDLDETATPQVSNTGAHVAVGARRAVSDRSDLGARLELDDVDGHNLLSVRAIDYRYRFKGPIALSVFVGASRYDLATPAMGLYYGGGLQWRDVLPSWDVGLDLRTAKKVARDHLLPSDPQSVRPDSFYTVNSLSLYLTKRF